MGQGFGAKDKPMENANTTPQNPQGENLRKRIHKLSTLYPQGKCGGRKKKMKQKKKSFLFSLLKKGLYLCYKKMTVTGLGFHKEQVIYVGNHCQIHGPITCELYFPDDTFIWCAGQMMNLKEVPSYAFSDFWSQKPGWTHSFFKALSYLIAPLSVFVFRNARTIPVYRDHRIMTTFKASIRKLNQEKSLVIFPEHDEKYNHIIYDFQRKFVDVASIFYRKSGKEVAFVPFYIAPKLGKIVIGEKIKFSGSAPIQEERERICKYLMDEITKMAEELPKHIVVPYRNVRKKDYPDSRA